MFIQAFSDNKPVFEAPWLPSKQVIEVDVPEEGQPGSTIYTLRAKDPVSGERLYKLPGGWLPGTELYGG